MDLDAGPEPILPPAELAQLRAALGNYTVDGVHERLELDGQAALQRGDLAGAARALHDDDGPLATLIRLFVLGGECDETVARRALDPLPVEDAARAGLLALSAGRARARLDLRPYAQQEAVSPTTPWWVLSDLGTDVRPGPLAPDHVLGVGSASVTLAQATLRAPVGRALDIGTGCGVQALHLGGHAASVTATDVSDRALQFAATTAALSDQSWDLRAGSLLRPVAGERFDQIVANPPFVVSPGTADVAGYDYRDSGRPGDELTRELLTGIPSRLAPGGSAQLLANWIIPADGDWAGRLAGWLDGLGCEAWIWQREVAGAGEYATLWLRDAGEVPGSARWNQRYDAWLDWFAGTGVPAVGMGIVFLWRPADGADGGDAAAGAPVFVAEDVAQPVQQPCGAWVPDWLARQRWLRRHDDAALLNARLRADDGLMRLRQDSLDPRAVATGPDHQPTVSTWLRQTRGACWEIEADEAITAVVAGCDGRTPLLAAALVLAASLDRPVGEIADALLPTVRNLIGRGLLLPPGDADLP